MYSYKKRALFETGVIVAAFCVIFFFVEGFTTMLYFVGALIGYVIFLHVLRVISARLFEDTDNELTDVAEDMFSKFDQEEKLEESNE